MIKTYEINGYKFTKSEGRNYHYNSYLRKSYHQYLWEFNYGLIPKGYVVHHKDHDKLNNDLSNLELMTYSEHRKHHLKHMSEESIKKQNEHLEKIREKTKEWHASEEGNKWHKEHYEKMKHKLYIQKDYVCNNCGKEFKSTKAGSKFCSNKCKSMHRRNSGVDDIKCECVICGGEFTKNKYSKVITCSKECTKKLKIVRRGNV